MDGASLSVLRTVLADEEVANFIFVGDDPFVTT
jgi:hypothetical protein